MGAVPIEVSIENIYKETKLLSKLTIAHRGDSSFVNDNTVDLILTDPPFNISKKTNFHTYHKNAIHSYQFDEDSDNSWDTYSHEEFLQKLDEWAKEWNRILKKRRKFRHILR